MSKSARQYINSTYHSKNKKAGNDSKENIKTKQDKKPEKECSFTKCGIVHCAHIILCT